MDIWILAGGYLLLQTGLSWIQVVDWGIKISVPILIVALTGVVGMLWKLNERQTRLEALAITNEEFEHLEDKVNRTSQDVAVLKAMHRENGRKLKEINGKLDRVLNQRR